MNAHRTVLAATLILCVGCAGASAGSAREPIVLEETRIVAHQGAGGEIETELYDASTLFARAHAMTDADCHGAVALYDRIASEFPTSRFVSPSLYNAGLCLQRGGELAPAIVRYRRLLEVSPRGRDARHAQMQLLEALIDSERWAETRDTAQTLLASDDVSLGDRLEGMARRAQALLGLGEIEAATRAAREALTFYRTRTSEPLDPYFAAAANFVLAETIRARSEAMRLPDADVVAQRETLDQRAALLLLAQAAYFDTIRFTDARWAAAAGFRIGSMYEGLYLELTTAPIPPPSREMSEAAIEVYRREYRRVLAERIRPLVRHAIRYWELTVLMIERTGVQGEWVARTHAELERARTLLLTGGVTPAGADSARALGSPVAPASDPTPTSTASGPGDPEASSGAL